MVLVVLGIDALDPDIVDPKVHPNLALRDCKAIETISSSKGGPSTHELWPTIITGLQPEEHGLTLDDGVAWENPILGYGSRAADYLLPDAVQTRIGAWLLTNTSADAFREPATYYSDNGLSTVFDGRRAKAIGIPNYVVDEAEDREHQLRRQLGDLFERDPDAKGGHRSTNPAEFYERCMEMAMIRVARVRRALRSRDYELVFGYTSGLDLIGHVAHGTPALQDRAYRELDEFVGELRSDLSETDELLLVSDHGLQDGVHTEVAMVAASSDSILDGVHNVTDVRGAIETELESRPHIPDKNKIEVGGSSADIRDHLKDLGYF